MTNTCPDSRPPSAVALMRYAVLAQVEALILGGCRASVAVRIVAARDHAHVDGRPVRFSVRTLQRWRTAFQSGGMASLEPQSRTRAQPSQVLSEALIDFLRTEKERDPRASVPELLRRARVTGIVAEDESVDRTTVWRACRRMGLATRDRPTKREADTRRWRYPHRMQCVLCDGKHFRAGGQRLRRVALFFLDDATRYALGVCVGTSESTQLFLRGLYDTVRRHGLPDLLYLDHGPGFIADDTLTVVQAGLKAWIVHGKARYPAGRGAVERFNRTASEQLLRALDGAAHVDADCKALTLRLQHWIDRYNDTPHQTLAGETPRQRWEAGRDLRFPDDEDDLYQRFVVHHTRTVSTDHVIKMDGQEWEAPRGMAGRTVQITRHVLDGRRWVVHHGRRIQLTQLDPHANAVDPRARTTNDTPQPDEGVPHTAATQAFDNDFRPIVDDQGGFSLTDKNEEDHTT